MTRLQVLLRLVWPSGRPLSRGSELQAPLTHPLFTVRPRAAPSTLTRALLCQALPAPFALPTRSPGALPRTGVTSQMGKLRPRVGGNWEPSWEPNPVPEPVCELAGAGLAAPAHGAGPCCGGLLGREGAALTWPMKGVILMVIPDREEEAPASAPPSWERGVEGAWETRVQEAAIHRDASVSRAQLARVLGPQAWTLSLFPRCSPRRPDPS